MRLRNISPLGRLDVPAIGRQGEPFGEPGKGCLEPGEEFDVPDKVAGRAPGWRPVTGEDTPDKLRHLATREVDGAREVFDLGSGLLASAGVFDAVAPEAGQPSAPAAPKRRGRTEGNDHQ